MQAGPSTMGNATTTSDIAAPLVCVVVLNYDGRDHLGYCLPSLAATRYPNFRLLVVDNASPDGSASMVADLCPAAFCIVSQTNLGWSGGNNLGIRAALDMGAKYVVLANNDIRVDPRWIEVAVRETERDGRIGVIGFDVFESPTDTGDTLAAFEAAQRAWERREAADAVYVGGMAMCVRSELFDRIGFIDEHFFAYGEENDFQIRARRAGYRIVTVNVPVWHYGQASFRKQSTRAAMLQTRNNIQLLIKYGSIVQLFRSGGRHVRRRIVSSDPPALGAAVEQRLRGPSPAMAFGLLLAGILWNLAHLPAILRRRREDLRRAEQARLGHAHPRC